MCSALQSRKFSMSKRSSSGTWRSESFSLSLNLALNPATVVTRNIATHGQLLAHFHSCANKSRAALPCNLCPAAAKLRTTGNWFNPTGISSFCFLLCAQILWQWPLSFGGVNMRCHMKQKLFNVCFLMPQNQCLDLACTAGPHFCSGVKPDFEPLLVGAQNNLFQSAAHCLLFFKMLFIARQHWWAILMQFKSRTRVGLLARCIKDKCAR